MKTAEIQKLLEWITQSGLQEVHIETEAFKLHVKRNLFSTQAVVEPMPTMGASVKQESVISSNAAPSSPEETKHVTIKSPMIGTFYRAIHPDAPPLVKVGDCIKPGDKLCVIEAMKLYNEIEAEISGTIVQVLVENASPVDYDHPLFLVDPS